MTLAVNESTINAISVGEFKLAVTVTNFVDKSSEAELSFDKVVRGRCTYACNLLAPVVPHEWHAQGTQSLWTTVEIHPCMPLGV